MKNTTTKKASAKKKLLPAAGSLLISAAMLGTSTYAWFTMNKEVKVTGMQMKAHAEEGLLINEVALATSPTWDEEAKAGDDTFTALRPASTYNLSNWWHANSKKVDNEAGYGSGSVDTTNTVAVDTGKYYSDISSVSDYTLHAAVAGSAAEAHVYYSDATFGSGTGSYEDGEGFYVKYTYYLKSSNSDDLSVAAQKLQAKVTAENQDTGAASGSTELDKSLRVGIKVNDVATDYRVFAPLTGADASYNVTNNEAGSAYTATAASWYSASSDYQYVNSGAITIPNVNKNGLKVDVYVWFEGEDTHCNSKNLTATLDRYKISIDFRDADIMTP